MVAKAQIPKLLIVVAVVSGFLNLLFIPLFISSQLSSKKPTFDSFSLENFNTFSALKNHIQGMGGSSSSEVSTPFNKRGEDYQDSRDFQDSQYSQDYQDSQHTRNSYLFPLNPGNFKEISSYYGPRVDVFGKGVWRNHEGIDLTSHTPQANVHAVADGIVLESYWDFVYGVMVKLEHSDGSTSLYAHLFYETQKKYQLRRVSKGDKVKRGQILGRIGNTGISTAPHLHFELNVSQEKANNPMNWLNFPE